ncbi:coiled-coil domain-containing protein 39-like isoform X2 [Lycorma delicatula]|uniref:coiled-coil domain-containing protein 39-like isoform X2 n=1 Tax=Lycorma delicatula TaxID=130591 RepID=UPI003F51A9D6
MVRQMSQLLKELGWADGFHVPVANKENKELETEVEELLREKADLILNLEALSDLVCELEKQLKNYEIEVAENRNMLNSRRHQVESEYTRLRCTEGEYSRLSKEIANAEKELKEYTQTHTSLKSEIDKLMGRLNKLKAEVEGGEDALLKWSESLGKGTDETNLIEKFCKEDKAHFEELDRQRKKLQSEVEEREKVLNSILNDKLCVEMQMQQCGKLYRRAVDEHRNQLRYWDMTISFLKLRDNKVNSFYKEITAIKKNAIIVYKELLDKRKFRDNQVKNNDEVKEQLEKIDKDIRLCRQAGCKLENENRELEAQAKLMQSMLSNLGAKVTEHRSLTSVNSAKLESKTSFLQRALEFHEQLKHQYDRLITETVSQVEANHHLENIKEEVLKGVKLVDKDNEKLKKMLAEQWTEYSELKCKASLRLTELRHNHAACKGLGKHINEIKREIHHQHELLYSNRHTLTKILSKIAKIKGEKQDIYVKEKLCSKIHELEVIYKEKADDYTLISGQVKHTEEDLRRMIKELESGKKELHHLMNGTQDRGMTVEGGRKKLFSLQETNQQLQVELNLLQWKVSTVMKKLSREDDCVYNLQKQNLELEAAVKERRIEIKAQKDILIAKKRTLQDEKSELKRTTEHLNTKTYQLQKRFEVEVDMLGNREGLDESVTITECKIKIAQEKSELQEKGDGLDTKIRKTEKEILAMENTLKLINASNDAYRKNLSSVDADSPEMENKEALESKFLATLSDLKKQSLILKTIRGCVLELEKSLAETEKTEERLKLEWKAKDKEATELDKELFDQQGKLVRAEKQYKKVHREVQSLREHYVPIPFAEKDIETREMQEINKSAIQQLADVAYRYIETAPVINRYLSEKELTLVSPRKSKSRSGIMQSSSTNLTPRVHNQEKKMRKWESFIRLFEYNCNRSGLWF